MRLLALSALSALALVSLPSVARADQCAYNDRAVVEKAAELAKKAGRWLDYCEPCRARTPDGPYPVATVAIDRDRQLVLNGKPVDLAYTYIYTGNDTYANLGLAAGCSAERVSKTVVDKRPVRPGPSPQTSRFPSPRDKITSVDDIAGTWTVTLRPNLTTCGTTPPARTTETWVITAQNGAIVVNMGNGLDDFEGSVPALETNGTLKGVLATRSRPSANALQVGQSVTRFFWGKILRSEPTGHKGDPHCVTLTDVSGTRSASP